MNDSKSSASKESGEKSGGSATSSDHENSIRILLTIIISLGGKILGFFRVQQIAVLLGASYHADVLMLGFQLLWLVEIVLISAAVVPSLIAHFYRQEKDQGEDAATALLLHAALISCAAALVYGLGVWIFARQIGALLAPGLHEQAISLFADLMLYGAAVPFVLALAHFAALLNRLFDNGIWYSVPQLVTNPAGLAGLLAGYSLNGFEGAVAGMILSLLAATFAMVLIQIYVVPTHVRARFFHRIGQFWPRIISFSGRRSFWATTAALVGTAFIQEAYIYVDMFFASSVREGGVGILGYASKLATLTNMLVVASAFVILEPLWARAFADQGALAVHDTISKDVLSILCILAVPSALLIFYGEMIADIVYGGKNGAPDDLKLLGTLISAYGGAVIGFGLSLMMARILNILGQPHWIAVINGICLPLKILLSYFMVREYGLVGLAVSTTFILFLQSAGYSWIAFRSGGQGLFDFSSTSRLVIFYSAVFLVTWGASSIFAPSPLMFVMFAGFLGLLSIAVGGVLKLSFVSALLKIMVSINQMFQKDLN